MIILFPSRCCCCCGEKHKAPAPPLAPQGTPAALAPAPPFDPMQPVWVEFKPIRLVTTGGEGQYQSRDIARVDIKNREEYYKTLGVASEFKWTMWNYPPTYIIEKNY